MYTSNVYIRQFLQQIFCDTRCQTCKICQTFYNSYFHLHYRVMTIWYFEDNNHVVNPQFF